MKTQSLADHRLEIRQLFGRCERDVLVAGPTRRPDLFQYSPICPLVAQKEVRRRRQRNCRELRVCHDYGNTVSQDLALGDAFAAILNDAVEHRRHEVAAVVTFRQPTLHSTPCQPVILGSLRRRDPEEPIV